MSLFQSLTARGRASVADSVLWNRLTAVRALWRDAESLVASITRPRASETVDRVAATLIADSRTGRALASAVASVERAWIDSTPNRVWLVSTSVLDSTVARVRAVAWVAVIAMSTALLLQLAASRLAPLSWMVPAGVVVLGLLALVAAEPVATALTRRPS